MADMVVKELLGDGSTSNLVLVYPNAKIGAFYLMMDNSLAYLH